MSLVEVQRLRVELAGSGVDIVDEVSFTIDAGEVLGLVGESGSGKTTVGLTLLGGARRGAKIVAGKVLIDGEDVLGLADEDLRSFRGNAVAYIPQDPFAALNPALRVGRQIEELFEFHRPLTSTAEVDARIRETLEEVRLPTEPAFLKRYPHQLSGGQQQRIVIAMAFVLRPKVIVLDEPTTGLDVTTQAQVLRTVRDLCAIHRVAALYVTHDLAVVGNLTHRIAVMYAGRLVEVGTTEKLFREPAHPYTRRLIAAVPLVSERRELVAIAGQAPAPGARPEGCSFHPRCEDALPDCERTVPESVSLGPDHEVRCLRASGRRLGLVAGGALVDRLPRGDGAPPLLRVTQVDAFHGKRQILYGVDLELHPRECLAVVGESGSGKTTLARCLVGLHPPRQGLVEFKGARLATKARTRSAEERRTMQYIFQSPYTSLNPRRSVGEILRFPLDLFFSLRRAETETRVAEVLERVSLSPRTARQYPEQLSGGERQRVAIARALVCRPEVLICDEITSALDVSVQASIVRLLRELQEEEGLALLFVTHNLALVRTVADRVLTLNQGRIVEVGSVADVLDHPQDPYTQGLIADTPTLAIGGS